METEKVISRVRGRILWYQIKGNANYSQQGQHKRSFNVIKKLQKFKQP